MRILVTASRTWPAADNNFMWREIELVASLAKKNELITIVHGDASGGDQTAKQCALYHKNELGEPWEHEPHKVTSVQWRVIGKAAGQIRNKFMVSLGADKCLAFILDNSRGATKCADFAEAANIPTSRFNFNTVPIK